MNFINGKIFSFLAGVVFLTGYCGLDTSAQEISKNTDAAAIWAKKTLDGLTLEKKVAQLVCTDITGVYLADDDPRMQFWLKLAREYGIGGFVLYGGTPDHVALLLNRLQQAAEIPLLISADFEGGPGQQVSGASEFPGNMAFAATHDENLMYEAAKTMAAEGRAMGIHLTYTPVTDISIYPDNPQESVRSFGGDIDWNGRLLTAYVKGYKETGMLTTAKHFPGRGNMKAFAEFPGFNYLDATAGELNQNEFRAFQYAVDAGVDFIMTEHLAVPSVTGGSKLPASMESRLIKGVIRDQLGFKGLITTDDLWYDYVVARFGAEEAAVKALEAGHDIVLKPRDPMATIQSITKAVSQGRIKEEQINQSVYKLLFDKARLGLDKNRLVDVDRIGQVVGTSAHQKLIQTVADRSVTLLRNTGGLPVKSWDPAKSVQITVQKEDNQPSVFELNKRMSAEFKGIINISLKPGMSDSVYDGIRKAADNADLVILSFFVQRDRFGDPAPIKPEIMALINQIIDKKGDRCIAFSYGNPHIMNKLPTLPVFLTGYGETGWYGNQQVYFDSFIRILKGELVPSGKLPVKVNDNYPVGFGLTY
ncbi:MAG: glycoside hydrolase family 3 N-terminal domain-containing protein [Bacteroidales bacterium]|jgi:beta-N-acetylhexosaminidase